MAHYIMSEVSPKDFDKFDNSIRSELMSNYAEQFGRRLKKNGGYKQAFEAVYGSNWHRQSYNKLLKLAKMLPMPSQEYKPGYKYSFNSGDKLALFYSNNLEQNMFVKKVGKLYGKKAVQWLRENRNYLGREKAYADAVASDCQRIIKSHNYIATHMKDIKAEYMSKAKKDICVAWRVSGVYNDFDKLTKDTILIGDLKDDILGQYIRATIRCEDTCYAERDSLNALIKQICNNIASDANSTRYYDANTHWGMKRRKAMLNSIHHLQQANEFGELLDKLGLQVRKDYYNGRRLNGKLLSMLKNVARAKVSNDTKQETAITMSAHLYQNNYNRNVYSPVLEARKESK